MPASVTPQASWFATGLRFSCTQCGNCCTGEPGATWISAEESRALAAHLYLDEAAFLRRYTATVYRDGRALLSLVEVGSARGNACVFYRHGVGCSIYEHRPRQCRTWPFWRRNLTTRAAWTSAARACPGMDSGKAHAAAKIAAIAADDGLPDSPARSRR